MNEITLIMFIIQFLIYMAVLIFKTYNVMVLALDTESRNDYKQLKIIFISLIIALLFYGVGFLTTLSAAAENAAEIIYITLFKLETWSLVFLAGVFIIELFYTFAKLPKQIMAAGSK